MKTLLIDDCRRAVCNYYRIPKDILIGPRRDWPVARKRQMAMVLAREFTSASTTQIGIQFGGRDHTTVMHASAKISELENDMVKIFGAMHDLRLALATYRAQLGSDP